MPYKLRISKEEVEAELIKMGFVDFNDEIVKLIQRDLLKLIKSDLKKLKALKEVSSDIHQEIDGKKSERENDISHKPPSLFPSVHPQLEKEKPMRTAESQDLNTKEQKTTSVTEYKDKKSEILLIGDSRARGFYHSEARPSGITVRTEKGMEIGQLRKIMARRSLWCDRAMIIFATLHCDFTTLVRSKKGGAVLMRSRRLSEENNMARLLEKYEGLVQMIREEAPNCKIVLTLPYTPDFVRYNSSRMRGRPLWSSGLSKSDLREDEFFFSMGMGAFKAKWDVHLQVPLLECGMWQILAKMLAIK